MWRMWQFFGRAYREESDADGGDGGSGADGAEGSDGSDGGSADKSGLLSTAGGWELAEGVPGEGDRPDWFNPKYKNVMEQAKAQRELETRQGEFGTYFGAPESDYELSLPEGVTGEFDNENPLLGAMRETAKEVGLSQEGFNKLLHAYVEHDAGLVLNHAETVANVASELGENGEQVIKDTWDRLQAVLPEEQALALDAVVTDANAIRALQTLLTAEAVLPQTDTGELGEMTRDELRAMRAAKYPDDHPKAGKQRYGDDKDWTKKVDDLYKKRFPGDDVQVVNPVAG